jgi:aldehyde:ferredoxin oxidoreductase
MFRLWEKTEQVPAVGRVYSRAARHQPNEENGRMAAAVSMLKMVIDGAGLCLFGAQTGIDRFQVFELINAATGWQKAAEEYLEIGKRIQTLRQMFNVREGVDPRSLKVSPRAQGIPPLEEGPLKGKTYDLDALMQHYWLAMGWDSQTGIPLPETVQQLGLSEIAGDSTSDVASLTERA